MVKRNFKYFIFVFFVLFFITQASAQEYFLGVFKQNSCVDLKQTCADCDFVNIISVIFPNSSEKEINENMTKRENIFNYTFCETKDLGKYIYWSYGKPSGVPTVAGVSFLITPTGKLLSSEESNIYIIGLIVLIFLFILCCWGAVRIPWRNERNNEGEVIKINWKKYLKMFCMAFAYLSLIWVFYFACILSYAFSSVNEINKFFYVPYTILLALMYPIFLTLAIFSFIALFNDVKINKFIKKMFPNEI